MTELTIIFPTYNDRDTLKEMLDQLSEQSCPFDIVIVDDCSTDDTISMLEMVKANSILSLEVIQNSSNVGPGPSRNTGVEHCKTKYFSFLDSDDFIKPNYVSCLKKITQNEFDVALFKYDIATDRQNRHTAQMHATDKRCLARFSTQDKHLLTEPENIWAFLPMTAFPWNKVYSKCFYDGIGAAFPARRLQEDILPHWQVLMNAQTVFFDYSMPSLLTHYEISDGIRATNARSFERLEAYEDLKDILVSIQARPKEDQALLINKISSFVAGLDRWVMNNIPASSEVPIPLLQLRLDLLTALGIEP
ncbi:glycosyltransferase family 2 protein [Aliiroseovarius sp. KMU-50]|uniref:Glycosyltransferase family 2 protein n=1 Tax=Aliiroseovarius salicola TaxID=3009082 RepID=A0ABT4VX68_9RHOB|nr:glycosyltransferase family 2 protein [Aliiroseovarius sp. KMU-50]MDA5092858.1 glycosyltransferase family 2 protein [Aliiroseovarius sp. KMU-50]